ncbi:MAG TPA: protease pro-enzyme activation domain-containing protein [Anaeromyxobacteraceae bacterium]|nr:protease pro-enzyme activation domain-containing protein [Anaeromyxobacteraceae bacterium]
MPAAKLPPILACFLAAAVPPRADAANRVREVPDDRRVAVVRGTAQPLARSEADLGRAGPDTPIRGVTILFSRSPEQQAALDRLLAEQQDPASPNYRKWLAPDAYAARFGLSEADLAAVAAWLGSRGLTVERTSPARTWISFSGTFGQVEGAFHTEMHRYAGRTGTHFANAGDISVPAALAGVVAGVRNLDDYRPEPRVLARPMFTSELSGNHFLTPSDFAAIYGIAPLYAAGLDGTGQKVAVVGQSAFAQSDVDAFRSAAGLPASTVQTILVPGTGASRVSPGDVDEACLDVEWSGGVARGAQVVYVYSGSSANSSVWDALQYAVDHDVAPVVSISYGNCEPANGQSFAQLLRSLAQQANAQGQTLVAASGDRGAADCESSTATVATHGLAVDIPASVPEFTGVGGTQFDADVGDASRYWSPSNGPGGESATGYIPEAIWNETSQSGMAATGGGASAYFTKPTWQVGAGVPADGHRDVPDVALAAAAGHDGFLICSSGWCTSGFRDAQTYLDVVGGTSASAPSFAGIVALLNEATAGPLGNVNPVLYQLATAVPAAFHPATSGDNFVPCAAGTANCPSGGTLGVAANGAYSLAAGLGSLDVGALARAWPGYVQRAATSTAVAASGAAPSAGSSFSLVATVSSASPGTPSGTVQFAMDGSTFGAPVTLVEGTAALFTVAPAAGTHLFSATYAGDAVFLPSAATPLSELVTDYAVALAPASLTVAAGGTATATVAVSAIGPFAGTVALGCLAPDGSGLSCSVSPEAVTFDGGTASVAASLQISSARATARALPRGGPPAALALAALAAAAVVAGPGRRSRRALLALVVASAVGGGVACGGSAGPPGTGYTLTVQGTTGSVSRSASIQVTVR